MTDVWTSVGVLVGVLLVALTGCTVTEVLDRFRSDEVDFHGLQTRQPGRQRFVAVHVLVPGAWTVFRGHDLLEEIESAIRAALPDTSVQSHLEPREDPRAYADYANDTQPPAEPT